MSLGNCCCHFLIDAVSQMGELRNQLMLGVLVSQRDTLSH
jgi:hypothetical protein